MTNLSIDEKNRVINQFVVNGIFLSLKWSDSKLLKEAAKSGLDIEDIVKKNSIEINKKAETLKAKQKKAIESAKKAKSSNKSNKPKK